MNKTHPTSGTARGRSAPKGLTRFACALAVALGACVPAAAQSAHDSPQQAADELIHALAVSDADAISRLLGKEWRQLLPLGGLDPEDQFRFLEKASQARSIDIKGDRAELSVGTDPWTLPIPMQRSADGRWRFDPVAARTIIAERRIGANELSAMQAALAYVDAQREYASVDRNGDGLFEYAQKLVSSPGKRDGLIWSPSLGDESPLGESYLPPVPGQGYHGYRFKVLKGQGPSAPGGARSYLIGKRMTAGYALLAWPVRYGETGVMSFIVDSDGRLFESNLGPQTTRMAAAISLFDPDDGWKPVKP